MLVKDQRNTLSFFSSRNVNDQVSHPYKTTGEIIVLYIIETVSIMPDTVDTAIWAVNDKWRYHPKHVEQFVDTNELYIVATC